MIGTTLSHYRIISRLGRGGMGIVYLAEDTKLDRQVALKILPASALASKDDRARFYREAKAAAQLHHGNIASVFEIDEAVPEGGDSAEPRPFIAMEYIEGVTLEDRIREGPLKLTEAVEIAKQIAEALRAAHDKDIVHRDIKSANIMLSKDGQAKVLDFGLAKTVHATMLTQMGSTLGTIAYMSPEQARGEEVDGRSDLYSLGTVLFEMVAGRLPFKGEYEQAIVYGILNEQPEPLTSLRTGVPMDLERIVDKLLEKDPDLRYQSAAGLLSDLKPLNLAKGPARRSTRSVRVGRDYGAADGAPDSLTRATHTSNRTPPWMWGAFAGILMIGLAVGWFGRPIPEDQPAPAVRFTLTLPVEETLTRRSHRSLAISPDGSMLAYLTEAGVRLRQLADLTQSRLLPGLAGARSMLFSKDSKWLIFENGTDRSLMRVPVSGGTPVRIARLPARLMGATLSDDGTVFLGLGQGGLGRVPEEGGSVEMVLEPEGPRNFLMMPTPIPGTSFLVYSDVYFLANKVEIRILDMDSGEDRLLYESGVDPRYIPSLDMLVFYADNGSLFELPFDRVRGVATGPPIPLLDTVDLQTNTGGGQWDVSDNGTVVWLTGSGSLVNQIRLDWISPDGRVEMLSPDTQGYWVPRISPDGSDILVGTAAPSTALLLIDAERGTTERLAAGNNWAVWSPDGSRVAYFSAADDLVIHDLQSRSVVDTLINEDAAFMTDWSSDGRYLVYFHDPSGLSSSNLSYYDLESNTATEFLSGEYDTDFGRLSPEGDWIAYETNVDGSEQIHMRRFPGGEDLFRVTTTGGTYPVWSRDGRWLYYADPSRVVMRVEVEPETQTVGPPEVVYFGPMGGAFSTFDIHPDGRLLVMSSTSSEDRSEVGVLGREIEFIVNWPTMLAER